MVLEEEDREIRLAAGQRGTSAALSGIATHLRSLPDKTAAFRAVFARADGEAVVDDARPA